MLQIVWWLVVLSIRLAHRKTLDNQMFMYQKDNIPHMTNRPHKKAILLVNPLSSAAFLSVELEKYSIRTTALYTLNMDKFSAYIRPAPHLFDEQFFFVSTDILAIISRLGDRKFNIVLSCFDGDISLSDNLAIHYSQEYANNPITAAFRSDKFLIQQILKEHGLPYIKQTIYEPSGTFPSLRKFDLTYPCFVKPLASAGSIGAKKVANDSEMKEYFLDKTDFSVFAETTKSKNKFLIAEFVSGTEFFIDTFSLKGQHFISSIQKYYKEFVNGDLVCRYSEIVNDADLIHKISKYTLNLLNITEFNNGFAHTEMFITPNGEIKLIEINPRVSGAAGFPNKMAQLCGLPSQVDLLLEHCFKIRIQPEKKINFMRLVILYNFYNRPLAELRSILLTYSGIFEFKLLHEDDYIPRPQTESDITSALVFILVGANSYSELEKTTEDLLSQDKNNWSN